MIPIVSIVGRSNTGKTTLIEGIIPELKKQGYRVATIKHNLHGFDVDREGKDSWRHRRAGASTVVLAAPRFIVVFDEPDREYDIKGIAENYIKDRDIIITEGFKGNPLPKIEVFRSALKAGTALRPRRQSHRACRRQACRHRRAVFRFERLQRDSGIYKRSLPERIRDRR